MKQYWDDFVNEAFEDAKIQATKEQIDTVVSWIEGAHENYSMASGDEIASRNFYDSQKSEIEKLNKELYAEKEKRVCPECMGARFITTSRVITTYGPIHSATSGSFTGKGANFIIIDDPIKAAIVLGKTWRR